MKMKTITKGFTLIELLIVIAIIGILAGVVIVSVSTARSKATNTRVQAEVTQVRTQLEQSLANNAYLDLAGDPSHRDQLSTTSAGYGNLTTLLCDIGNQNGYNDSVPNDISLTCNATPSQHSGVVIISNSPSWTVSDYAVYATTSPSGYICVDSFGNTAATSSAFIPDYSGIYATSTALCQ